MYKLNGRPPFRDELPYDYKDFDEDRLIKEITDVISSSTMNNESTLLLNLGLHYVMGIPVKRFVKLMDKVSSTLLHYKENNLYNGTVIWKTTTALQKWKYGTPESNARHAKSHRFLTAPVRFFVLFLREIKRFVTNNFIQIRKYFRIFRYFVYEIIVIAL